MPRFIRPFNVWNLKAAFRWLASPGMLMVNFRFRVCKVCPILISDRRQPFLLYTLRGTMFHYLKNKTWSGLQKTSIVFNEIKVIYIFCIFDILDIFCIFNILDILHIFDILDIHMSLTFICLYLIYSVYLTYFVYIFSIPSGGGRTPSKAVDVDDEEPAPLL